MTEEEAKTKGCCMPLTKVFKSGDQLLPMCIGSDCMAWRWWEEHLIPRQHHSTEHGYCGLAGKP